MSNPGTNPALLPTAALGLPRRGLPPEDIWSRMEAARQEDADWRAGRVPGLVYLAPPDVVQVAQTAYTRFAAENGLSGVAFPSLRRFEAEVIGMTAGLLHGTHAVGNITSGGTESILLAVKGARDRARAERPAVWAPEIVAPVTAHPAVDKAAHYFGLRVVRTPVGPDYRLDLAAYRAAVTDNTVLLVGSAPNYPYGMVDPIPQMAALAAERDINFHVDACLGGFFLPFAERLGYPVPPFDFRVPGVTSISADLHKFGYTAKGASALLWRDRALYHYQGFSFDGWSSGVYRTPTLAGTRPGGAIAAAWAVLTYLGEEGYLRLVAGTMQFVRRLLAGIAAIPELEVHGQPDMSVFAYGARHIDIDAVADELARRGWWVYRERQPPGIHLILSAGHEPFMAGYVDDLAEATRAVVRGGLTSQGREVRYG